MKRKGFLVVVILAIIAVVLTIVFINLFKERDTDDLSKSLNRYVSSGYLNDEDENFVVLDDYFTQMSTKLAKNDQTLPQAKQAENYKNVYSSLAVLAEFINNELTYSEYADVYKQNKKSIESSLKTAQRLASQLAKDITLTLQNTSESEYWTINTWKNFEDDLKKMMNKTIDATQRLMKVYSACVSSKLMNNSLTDIVFERVDSLLTFTKENDLESTECGEKVSLTINYYLADIEPILNYVYDQSLQLQVEDIKEKGSESSYYLSFCNCTLDIEVA